MIFFHELGCKSPLASLDAGGQRLALSALGVIDRHDRAGGCVGFLLGIGADTALERDFAGKGLLRARRAPSKLR